METAERVAGIIAALKKEYPDALCALHYGKDYELMIAVRLSAQCTDARVNLVRSEERRVGKECSDLCRSRWSPYH